MLTTVNEVGYDLGEEPSGSSNKSANRAVGWTSRFKVSRYFRPPVKYPVNE